MKTTLPNSNSTIFNEPVPAIAYTNTRQEVDSLLQGLNDIQRLDRAKRKQPIEPFGWLPSHSNTSI